MKRAIFVALLVLAAVGTAAHRSAAAQVQPAQVQLSVTNVEMVPTPAPPTATPTPSSGHSGDSGSDELFVYVDISYAVPDAVGADVLHLSPSDLVLRDAHGNLHYNESYVGSGKLSSKDLIAASPTSPGTAGGWLHYTVSTGGAGAMSLLYMQTQQTVQGQSNRVIVARHKVTAPAKPTAYRVYATAAQPVFRAYLLDEAPAAGYIALTVDPLYENGVTTATPRVNRAMLERQGAKLTGDHKAFDAVPASDSQSTDYRKKADDAFTAIEMDFADIGGLRTPVQWAGWQARFALDNQTLAALYETWPSVAPSS